MSLIRARVKPKRTDGLNPIARWDVVPYQRIASGTTFKAGVVAFSKEGISNIAFSTTDGTNTVIDSSNVMTLNSRIGVWEYWIEIDPADFSDGTITLSATVLGNDGGNQFLDDITLIADSGGTVAQPEIWVDSSTGNDSTGTVGNQSLPCLTIEGAAAKIAAWMNSNGYGNIGDGGIIYLEQGDHTWGAGTGSAICTNEWLTITLAVGGTKANTRIVGTGGTSGIRKIKIEGVYIWYGDVTSFNGLLGRPGWPDYVDYFLWLDGVEGTASDAYRSFAYVSRYYPRTTDTITQFWATGSYFHEMRTMCEGAVLLRGLTIANFGDDALHGAAMVVNCTADTLGTTINKINIPVTLKGPSTIVRTDGVSWLSMGFAVGMTFAIKNSINNNSNDDYYPRIASVTASTVVLVETNIISGSDTANFGEAWWHTDAWQYWGHIKSDIITYNYKATNLYYQGVMSDSTDKVTVVKNVAFVNVLMMKAETLSDFGAVMSSFLWQLPTDHFLIWNFTADRVGTDKSNSNVYFLGKGGYDNSLTNFSFRNSVAGVPVQSSAEAPISEAEVDNNHFNALIGPIGDIDTNTTTGDAMLDDYGVPLVGSPAIDRVIGTALVPIDLSNPLLERIAPSNAGAFET